MTNETIAETACTEKKSLLKACYDYCLKLSRHRYAKFFMCINSFIESIFWPIPVEAILLPMCLAQPKKSLGFAFYATISSVLGVRIRGILTPNSVILNTYLEF